MTKIYYIFSKDIHIPPSELDNMYWYDIVFMLKEHQAYIENENEEYDRQQQEYESKYQTPEMPKYEAPKMPNMPDFSSLSKGFM